MKIILGIIILVFYSCSGTHNSSRLDSSDYSTKEKRIKVLKKEIKSFSEFENAEFELFNVNGFSNNRNILIGASSFDYKYAIKVKPSKIDKWIDGMILVDSVNYNKNWLKKLIQKREDDWKTLSKPEVYIRKEEEVIMIVYRTEGKIFKRVVNL